jgi:hypothetical protein
MRTDRIALILAMVLWACAGCGPDDRPPAPDSKGGGRSASGAAPKLPEVTSEAEEGFFDLVFTIVDHGKNPDGSQLIQARGTHKGVPLGLAVWLGPQWKKGRFSTEVKLTTHTGVVAFRSSGPESDALLQTLDRLYGTKQDPKSMAPETSFTGLSLQGEPAQLDRGLVKIKMFFESKDDKLYAELFTNIDLKERKLWIREKDPDYRLPLVRVLQGAR